MGVVSIGTSAVMNGIALFGYAALYVYVAPWQLPANAWYTWVIAIVGVDFLYYWYHRMAHRVRLFWATHQAHHSSQYFNLATALRQKWNISGDVFLRALLPLFGVPPWMVFASFSINLSTSTGFTPNASGSYGGQSNSSSTRRRTTGCTTVWTRSIWTGTTAAS